MKLGDSVKAYPLDGSGPKLGDFHGAADQDGKDDILVGGDHLALAYREPVDRDENGPNGTYCTV